jgi:hypothetical protein
MLHNFENKLHDSHIVLQLLHTFGSSIPEKSKPSHLYATNRLFEFALSILINESPLYKNCFCINIQIGLTSMQIESSPSPKVK